MIFSRLYLPNKLTSEGGVSRLYEKILFSENRSAEIQSLIYDKEQGIIEIMMLVNNKNSDGIDDYYYATSGVGNVFFKNRKVEIEEVINNTLCLVIRLHHVKGFDEIEFLMAPKITALSETKDSDTLSVIINKYNLTEGIIDTKKTEKDYLIDRLAFSIQNIQNEISEKESKAEELSGTKAALENENVEIEKSKTYLTGSEIEEADGKISDNLSAIESIDTELSKIQEELLKLEKNLEEARITQEKIQNET